MTADPAQRPRHAVPGSGIIAQPQLDHGAVPWQRSILDLIACAMLAIKGKSEAGR